MTLRQTHTYAILEVSKETYEEICNKLSDAGYNHAFHEDFIIDMHGIAIQPVGEGAARTEPAATETPGE